MNFPKYLALSLGVLALVGAGCGPTTSSVSQQPTVSKTTVQLTKLTPSSGPTDTQVTITGEGFTTTGNKIMFGDATGRHHPDGSADNVIDAVASRDGKTVTFTVPASGPSGILCDSGNHCIAIAAMRRLPGNYKVAVTNANGTSNTLTFTIK